MKFSKSATVDRNGYLLPHQLSFRWIHKLKQTLRKLFRSTETYPKETEREKGLSAELLKEWVKKGQQNQDQKGAQWQPEWKKNATRRDQAVKARPQSSHNLLGYSSVTTQDQYRLHTQTWQYTVCEQQWGVFTWDFALFSSGGGSTLSVTWKVEKKKKENQLLSTKLHSERQITHSPHLQPHMKQTLMVLHHRD